MKLLIVENDTNHLAAAHKLVDRIQQAFDLDVRYARTLDEATNLIEWADAVVTDASIPEKAGESSRLDGLNVWCLPGLILADRAFKLEKPAVILFSSPPSGIETPSRHWARYYGRPFADVITGASGTAMDWEAGILFAIYLVRSGAFGYGYGCQGASGNIVSVQSLTFYLVRGALAEEETLKKILEVYYTLPLHS